MPKHKGTRGTTITLRFALLILGGGCFFSNIASAQLINFDTFKPGKLPSGWITGVTGSGTAIWSIERDIAFPSAHNVLRQSAEGLFPWCVKEDVSVANGWAEVKFKPLSGKKDQAGGIVFRFKDSNNYYIARANALEHNVTLYHTVEGKRRAFQSVMASVESNLWHTLRVDFQGNHFTVTYDGKKALEANDDKIKGPGKIGLWTKNDSVTLFDGFSFDGSALP